MLELQKKNFIFRHHRFEVQSTDENGNVNCTNCVNCTRCVNCHNCTNCHGCVDCMGCSDLSGAVGNRCAFEKTEKLVLSIDDSGTETIFTDVKQQYVNQEYVDVIGNKQAEKINPNEANYQNYVVQ